MDTDTGHPSYCPMPLAGPRTESALSIGCSTKDSQWNSQHRHHSRSRSKDGSEDFPSGPPSPTANSLYLNLEHEQRHSPLLRPKVNHLGESLVLHRTGEQRQHQPPNLSRTSAHVNRNETHGHLDTEQDKHQHQNHHNLLQRNRTPIPPSSMAFSLENSSKANDGLSKQSMQAHLQYHAQSASYSQVESNHLPQHDLGSFLHMTSPAAQRSMISIKRRATKEKAFKGDREEVWPPDVEKAFLKALEVLPKLGRRKVLVNGKPCGRNELIADYIYKMTRKVRDRKQVSSHIQVLKNTRKHDPAFMKLLMDSGDGDDDVILDPASLGYFSTSHSPVDSSPLSAVTSDSGFPSDQQSRHVNDGAVSPTHYPLNSNSVPLRQSSPCQVQPHYHTQYSSHPHDRNHHRDVSSESLNPVSDQSYTFQGSSDGSTCIQSIYKQAVTTPDSAVSLSSDSTLNEPMVLDNPSEASPISNQDPIGSTIDSGRVISRAHEYCFPPFPLWPVVFRLFIRYPASGSRLHNSDINAAITNSSFYDKMDIVDNLSATQTHELAQAQNLNHRAFGAISIQQLSAERFPCLYDHFQKATCAFMYFKVTMDMNLEQECTFENTCLFDSSEDRVVRCWTMIYSFGKNVLKSTEVKQAGHMDGKFVHSFEFVNQFFDAFLRGIRTLGTSDEVEVALANLSLVQIYEDLDPRTGNSVPLLVMAFGFEQGQGGVVPHFITDSSELLESVAP